MTAYDYMASLRRAKDARNGIAHEGALLPKASVTELAAHARRVISWVDDIDAADVRLAKFAHDIEEPKDPIPLRVFEEAAATRRAELVAGLAPLLQLVPEQA